jgi:hypothetical protein
VWPETETNDRWLHSNWRNWLTFKPLLTKIDLVGCLFQLSHAILEVKLGLQQLQPGLYLFWIPAVGTTWSYYPVKVRLLEAELPYPFLVR